MFCTILIVFSTGERPAAMQTGSAGLSSSARYILPLLLLPIAYQKLLVIVR